MRSLVFSFFFGLVRSFQHGLSRKRWKWCQGHYVCLNSEMMVNCIGQKYLMMNPILRLTLYVYLFYHRNCRNQCVKQLSAPRTRPETNPKKTESSKNHFKKKKSLFSRPLYTEMVNVVHLAFMVQTLQNSSLICYASEDVGTQYCM